MIPPDALDDCALEDAAVDGAVAATGVPATVDPHAAVVSTRATAATVQGRRSLRVRRVMARNYPAVVTGR
ncbi:hypothetical protein GCM10009818_08450 [Nakamurella flavida]